MFIASKSNPFTQHVLADSDTPVIEMQAWVETEYGHHNILNAGGSRTAESSIFSYDDISLSDAGGGNSRNPRTCTSKWSIVLGVFHYAAMH